MQLPPCTWHCQDTPPAASHGDRRHLNRTLLPAPTSPWPASHPGHILVTLTALSLLMRGAGLPCHHPSAEKVTAVCCCNDGNAQFRFAFVVPVLLVRVHVSPQVYNEHAAKSKRVLVAHGPGPSSLPPGGTASLSPTPCLRLQQPGERQGSRLSQVVVDLHCANATKER